VSSCHFQLEPNFREASIKEDGMFPPKGSATRLLMLSLGTTIGIIHAKKPDWLSRLVFPTMDVSCIFQQVVKVEL
jgi:hypothetical protein